MKKQGDRDGRRRKLLFVWVLLAVIMACAITITSISILTSQVKNDRDKAVTGAAELAAKEIDADRINDWLENGKDTEYEIQSGYQTE